MDGAEVAGGGAGAVAVGQGLGSRRRPQRQRSDRSLKWLSGLNRRSVREMHLVRDLVAHAMRMGLTHAEMRELLLWRVVAIIPDGDGINGDLVMCCCVCGVRESSRVMCAATGAAARAPMCDECVSAAVEELWEECDFCAASGPGTDLRPSEWEPGALVCRMCEENLRDIAGRAGAV